jgi:hypothetical protein
MAFVAFVEMALAKLGCSRIARTRLLIHLSPCAGRGRESHKRVYARLRRAMANEGEGALPRF